MATPSSLAVLASAAAEVMANETKRCRDQGRHREPGQNAGPFPAAPQLTARR